MYFTEDHELFRQSVRRFIETEVVPNAKEWEKKQQLPREIWHKMGELGFLGINYAEAYGGSDADFFYTVVFLEEIARCTMGGFTAAVSVHQYMAIAHLSRVGTHELKEKYLKPSIEGKMIGALAISEPSGGSDVAAVRTTAIRKGDHYIINGNKTFITNGVYSDFITVACRTEPDSKGSSGLSLIIVDREAAGVSANKLEKIGWHSSDTGEIFFEDVKVPVSNLIGKEGQAFYYIMESFQLERLVAAVMANAGCVHAIEMTLKYMNEREAFGRKIKHFQVLRHKMANIATELEAARHLTYYTSVMHSKGEYVVKEATMAKLLTSELGKKIMDECLQVFGGYGYIEDFPIARMYRDARVGTIVAGTSEIMREIIAKIMIDEVSYQSSYKEEQNESPAISPEKTIEQHTNTNPERDNNTTTMEKPTTAKGIIESLVERFRPEKAEGYSTTIHFEIKGNNGGQWTCVIKEGTCTVEEGHHGEASCLIRAKDKHYEALEWGKLKPEMAVLMGKIKLNNIPEMMQFTRMFKRLYWD